MPAAFKKGTAAPPALTLLPRPGSVNPVAGLYTPPGSRGAARFAAKVNRARSGQNVRPSVLMLGHSLFAGYGAAIGTADPGSALRWMLRRATGLKVGSGIVPTLNGDPGSTAFTSDSRWSKTGTWGSLATGSVYLPWSYGSSAGCTATFTSNTPGTAVDVFGFENLGNWSYQIDAASAVNVTATGAASTWRKVSVTGLPDTSHAVKLTGVSALTPLANVYYPNSIDVHNWGWCGATAAGMADPAYAQHLTSAITLCVPDVTIIMLGGNDLGQGVSVSAMKASLQSVISALVAAGSDVVLVGGTPASGTSDATWLPYREGLYDLAQTNACQLVDPYPLYGSYALSDANGYQIGAGDVVHQTAAGYQELARILSGALLPQINPGPTAAPIIVVPAGTAVPAGTPDGTLFVEYVP